MRWFILFGTLLSCGVAWAVQSDVIDQEARPPTYLMMNARLEMLPKKIEKINQRLGYSIHIYYPLIVGFPMDNAARNFNEIIDKMIQPLISEYKASFSHQTHSDSAKNNYYLKINYQSYGGVSLSQHADYNEILFNVDRYQLGMNKPERSSFTMSYDLGHNQSLALTDLFKPGPQALSLISNYCRKQLLAKKTANHKLIESGIAPIIDNYQNWYVNDDRDLYIIFKAGQVAPKNLGEQMVRVPEAVISNYLNEQTLCALSYKICDKT